MYDFDGLHWAVNASGSKNSISVFIHYHTSSTGKGCGISSKPSALKPPSSKGV